MASQLKITLKKSLIGIYPKHKLTAQALGLSRPGRSVVQKDNEAIRGMARQISYLVQVEEVE